MAGVHEIHGRVLERVRGAAAMHRLGEHEPAEITIVARLADDEPRRIGLTVRRARYEVFLRVVTEVLRVEVGRLRRRGVEDRAGAGDLLRQLRQRDRRGLVRQSRPAAVAAVVRPGPDGVCDWAAAPTASRPVVAASTASIAPVRDWNRMVGPPFRVIIRPR